MRSLDMKESLFDSEKPGGTFRKKMDNKRIFDLGFEPAVYLKTG